MARNPRKLFLGFRFILCDCAAYPSLTRQAAIFLVFCFAHRFLAVNGQPEYDTLYCGWFMKAPSDYVAVRPWPAGAITALGAIAMNKT
jgi:hypothetical protein